MKNMRHSGRPYGALIPLLILWMSTPLLSQTRTVIQDISWSHDESALFFSAMKVAMDYSDYSPGKWHVYRHDLEAHHTARILDSALYVNASPSGNLVAAGMLRNGQRDIGIIDLSNGDRRIIAPDPADDFAPSWSPDGTALVFNSKRDGGTEIYRVDVDGTHLKRLTSGHEAQSYNPSWSPDGRSITYYLEKGDGEDQIYVMNANGTDATNITRDTLNNIFPTWIDDVSISYAGGPTGAGPKAMTIRSDGTEKSVLEGFDTFYIRFSPTATMVAIVREGGIDILSPNGEMIERIEVP